MFLRLLVCSSVVVSFVRSDWVEDLYSQRGLDLGLGFYARLENQNVSSTAASFLEKNRMLVNYGNYGVSVSQNAKKNVIEVDLLREEPGKGRAQKMGNMILPAIIGFKAAGLTSIILFTIKVLVVKAFMVAKFALLISSAIFVKKFFFHEQQEPTYVEIEHHEPEAHPLFVSHEGGQEAHGSANYIAYANYVPSAAAQTQVVNYAVEAPPANFSATGQPQIIVPIAAKRADDKRQSKLPLYTIRKYTIHSA